MSRKVFAGEILTSADVNNLLMDQTVMRFASASARTAAIPQPALNMLTILDANGSVDLWNGTAWVPLSTGLARAQIYQTAKSGTYQASTWNAILLDAETIDTHNGHTIGQFGFIVPSGQGGLYLIDGGVAYASASTMSLFAVRLDVNDAVVPLIGHGQYTRSPGNDGYIALGSKLVTLTAGQTVTLKASGSHQWTTNLDPPGGFTSQLSLERVR